MLFTLLAFAIALGVLITFHELGHYWVARRCGVKVLRFSVGFGKVVLRRTDRHGTEWALSAIPLGGYVKMLDEPEVNATPQQAQQAFNRKRLSQRSLIVLAGPVANLVLAAFLYTILNLAGTTEPAAILAAPTPNSIAAEAGLREGDRIRAINGEPIQSWSEARWHLLDSVTGGGRAALQVETNQGIVREHELMFSSGTVEPDGADLMAEAGLSLAAPRPRVTEFTEGSPGQLAGLQAGDVIVAVDALKNPSARALVQEIQKNPGRTIPLTVLRDEAPVTLSVTPQSQRLEDGTTVGRIGVVLGADFPLVTVSHGLVDSVRLGVERTVDTVWLSLKMMGRMVVGDVSLRNVSGPVTIADYAGQTARIGLASYIGFLALISVSIGVLNLLPIPMLDGGHLMYYAIEGVRGKPIPEKWLENGQRIGLALLAGLMSLAFFNDFSRLFS